MSNKIPQAFYEGLEYSPVEFDRLYWGVSFFDTKGIGLDKIDLTAPPKCFFVVDGNGIIVSNEEKKALSDRGWIQFDSKFMFEIKEQSLKDDILLGLGSLANKQEKQ